MNLRLILLAVTVTAAGCGMQTQREPAGKPPESEAAARYDAYAAVVAALASGQPALQTIALETFLESDRPPPHQTLVPLAEAADPRVRMRALTLLGLTRRPDLLALFRRKLQDSDPTVRLAAAFALSETGDLSRVVDLRDGLASSDVTLRRTAAWLLGMMGNASAIGMLKVKLEDPDAVVVLRTAEAMYRLGSSDGLDAVRALLEHDRHQIRYWAVRLLGRIGTTSDVPRLEKLCQSRFLDVKFAAIAAVAELGDFKRIGLLLDMTEAPEADVRLLAATELGETAYTPAIERLEKILAAADPVERTTAAAAIVRIQTDRRPWKSRILADRPRQQGAATNEIMPPTGVEPVSPLPRQPGARPLTPPLGPVPPRR